MLVLPWFLMSLHYQPRYGYGYEASAGVGNSTIRRYGDSNILGQGWSRRS